MFGFSVLYDEQCIVENKLVLVTINLKIEPGETVVGVERTNFG